MVIKNVKDVRITKVKPWSIYFTVNGVRYMLHSSEEMGFSSTQTLYERQIDANGYWTLKALKNVTGRCDLARDYVKNYNGKPVVYKHVDYTYFVYKLTKRGFATGVLEEMVSEADNVLNALEQQIAAYQLKVRQLEQIRKKYN